GADGRDLQRAQIGRQIQRILAEEDVVAEIEQDRKLVVGPAVDLRVRRDGDVGLGEADLQHDDERQQEEQEQPQERYADHDMPPAGQIAREFGQVHDCSTTPLSSSQYTTTGSSQVGRLPRRSALAMKHCTTCPDVSLTWYTECPPR